MGKSRPRRTFEKMSLEWAFVFCFLVLELCAVLLLCIPWPQTISKYIVRGVTYFANGTVMIALKWIFGIVFVLFLEPIRQVYYRYDALHLEQDTKHRSEGLSANLYEKSGKFRAERNLYLAGFVLVLGLVLNRLIQLMAEKATMEDKMVAMESQAKAQQQSMSNPAILRALLESAEEAAPAEGPLAPKLEDLPSAPGGTADTKKDDSTANTGLRQRSSKKVD